MTLDEALTHAQQTYAQRQALAYNQQALDAVARAGFGNGAFEDDPDEALDVMEEFYSGRPVEDSKPVQKPSLNAKLERIAAEAEAEPA